MKLKHVNLFFCIVGLVAVWLITENGLAVFFAFIASIHLGDKDGRSNMTARELWDKADREREGKGFHS